LAHVSVKDAVGFSFSFLFRNVAQIAARIALPAMAGWIIFYVTFFLYLMELERYLGDPNDRIASLVLGLATAGLLATLFMHSIIVSSIVSLALGLKEAGWKYFRIGRPAWRLYAADLRFVLIGTAFIFAMRLVEVALGRFAPTAGLVWVADVAVGVGLYWLTIRLGFLIAPIAIARRQGEILRRGWRLSSGNFWRMTATAVLLMLPGLGIELIGEFIMSLAGRGPQVDQHSALATIVAMYRENLPEILIAVGIGYLVATTLLTLGRVSFYRQLLDQPES